MNCIRKLFRRRRVFVEFSAPEQLPAQELVSAFSVSTKHPLWRGVHQLLDDAQAAKITDALDPESQGEENAFRRGEANALAEFKSQLLSVHARARMSDE